MKKRSRYSPRARTFVARKIRALAREGYPAPRRIAQALSMARQRGLKVPPRLPNAGVPEEGPQEHIRNALASIVAERDLLKGTHHGYTFDPEELYIWLGQVEARLRTALQQLEDRRVNIGLSRSPKQRSVRHGNPALAILGANPRVEDATIASWAKIEYRRPDDPDGRNVIRVHEFKDGFEIGWLSDGTVQLSHPKHPLWTEDGE